MPAEQSILIGVLLHFSSLCCIVVLRWLAVVAAAALSEPASLGGLHRSLAGMRTHEAPLDPVLTHGLMDLPTYSWTYELYASSGRPPKHANDS